MTDKNIPEFRMVKSEGEKAAEALAVVLWLLAVYWWCNPGTVQHIIDYCRDKWHTFRHIVSIWETRAAIEGLPETDEPEM